MTLQKMMAIINDYGASDYGAMELWVQTIHFGPERPLVTPVKHGVYCKRTDTVLYN